METEDATQEATRLIVTVRFCAANQKMHTWPEKFSQQTCRQKEEK